MSQKERWEGASAAEGRRGVQLSEPPHAAAAWKRPPAWRCLRPVTPGRGFQRPLRGGGGAGAGLETGASLEARRRL